MERSSNNDLDEKYCTPNGTFEIEMKQSHNFESIMHLRDKKQ
jgi:hypothetical protein